MSWLDFDIADLRVDGEAKRRLDDIKRDDADLLDELPRVSNKRSHPGRPRRDTRDRVSDGERALQDSTAKLLRGVDETGGGS